MAKIACDNWQYLIRGLGSLTEPSENAEFDVEMAGISFGKWIDRLTPVISNRNKGPWDMQRDYQGKRFKFRSSLKLILMKSRGMVQQDDTYRQKLAECPPVYVRGQIAAVHVSMLSIEPETTSNAQVGRS